MSPKQATLFGYANEQRVKALRSHRSDPPTSSRAAKRAAPRARTHAAMILAALRARGRATATDLAGVLESGFAADPHARLYQVRRRLSELRKAGLVMREDTGGAESAWRCA